MMIASDLSRCVVVAALALADATGHLTFTLLLVLTLLNGLGDGFFFPGPRRATGRQGRHV
jgi:hypothetical protein